MFLSKTVDKVNNKARMKGKNDQNLVRTLVLQRKSIQSRQSETVYLVQVTSRHELETRSQPFENVI